MHSLERLFNLVALLLDFETPLTFEQIREKLPAYSQEGIGSAKRMFERDKDILRAQGVPIELVATDAWETDEGYVIDADRYYLPRIDFTEEELSALFVAAAAPGEDDEASQALRKLASGTGSEFALPRPGPILYAGPEASDETLAALTSAMADRRSVRFTYRNAAGESAERQVDPYSLVVRGGNVYLVGLDRAREGIRSYRLSRMVSAIEQGEEASAAPEGFVARDHVSAGPWGTAGTESVQMLVAFSPDVAWMAAGQLANARPVSTRPDGWVELEASVPLAADERLVTWILSFAGDAEVLAPQELRAAMKARLEAILASV